MYHALEQDFPGTSFQELARAADPRYGASNPSIALGPEGYKFTVRSSNYTLVDPVTFDVQDPEGIIRTTNYIGDMDDDLNVLSLDPVDTSRVDGPILYKMVEGMEDCRLFWDHKYDCWRMSGTYSQDDGSGCPRLL